VAEETAQQTLFEAIGGREGVRRLIGRFYELVAADEILRPVYPDDLGPGEEKLALFFEQWLGGPPAYSEKYGHPRLRRRHFPFQIAEVHAGRWLRNMRLAMQDSGWPREAADTALEQLGPLAHHMVNAGQDVPREPLGDVRLE
jgi:hemoglobin